MIEKTLSNVRNSGYAYTILGRRREVTGHPPRYHGQMNLAERTAFNAVIQGSAADLIKLAMIAVSDRLQREDHPARLLLQIHDELLFETPGDRVEDLSALVTEEMTAAMSLDVPVAGRRERRGELVGREVTVASVARDRRGDSGDRIAFLR